MSSDAHKITQVDSRKHEVCPPFADECPIGDLIVGALYAVTTVRQLVKLLISL